MYLVAVGLALAAVAVLHTRSKAEHADESRQLEDDLQEVPDPMRSELRSMIFLTQPSDVPQLEIIAATLETKGYARAAARIRARIAQLKGGK